MNLKGQLFGRYRFQDLLKRGGMAEVYLADDERLDRRVAIKVIWTDLSHYADADKAQAAIRLFLREAQTLAKFDHRHILPIFDSGEGQLEGHSFMFLVMPYHQAGSLSDWLHTHSLRENLSLWDINRILQQAASALQYAHDMNIVHQDVKASNFLVHGKAQFPSQLELQLADFGIAKFMTTTSKTQEIRGTPQYMAPEQWDNHPLPATDQYALAVMVYELLTGRSPFTGDNKEQLWHQHCHAQPPLPSTLNPTIPYTVDTVILRALAKRPAQRFSSAANFAKAFRQALLNSHAAHAHHQQDEVVSLASLSTIEKIEKTAPVRQQPNSIPPDFPPSAIPPRHRRGRLLTSLIVLLALLVVSSSLYLFWSSQQHTVNINLTATTIARTSVAKNNTTTAAHLTGTAQTNTTDLSLTATANSATSQTATAATQTATSATQTAIASATNITNTQIAAVSATAAAYTNNVTSGPVLLSDPLQDNTMGHNWDTTNYPDGSDCVFSTQTYHAIVGQQRIIQRCFAQGTNFTNFSCQVSMSITTGQQGGIVFRGDASKGNYYYFHISTDGSYGLDTYSSDTPSSTLLAAKSNPVIHPRSDGTYVIAIVAISSTFQLFVNGTQIDSVTDPQNTYDSGEIGVVASTNNPGNPTDISFLNINVWGK